METNTDHISILPREVLFHILSKLSFKEAVRTSFLSSSWRSLMSPFRVNVEELMLMDQFIESCQGFQTLKLYLNSSMAFAVCTKGLNGELHLNFSELGQKPRTSFSLIIEQGGFLCRPGFSCIKILHLRSVSHIVGDMVSDLCSSCSSLESLKIEKCKGLKNIDLKCCKSLKKFEMDDCPDIAEVVVSGNSINFFYYKGFFTMFQFLDVPNLSDVRLDFGHGLGGNVFDCEDVLFLLSSVKDVETLAVSSWFIEALCCRGVIFSKLDFQFSKLKELKLICSKISSKTRDSFACFLHTTPSLEEIFIKIDYTSSSVNLPFSHQHWHEPHLWKDYTTVKSEASRLKYLKKIRVTGFTMERDERLWMDFLLHNAINLKEMMIDDFWTVARIPHTQLDYLKSKYFLIPCHEIDSYFVLIEHSTSPKL